MHIIANHLKESRVKKGLTQEALAELSNVSLRTIQRIELGQVQPRNSTLSLLTEILDTHLPDAAEVKGDSVKSVRLLKLMNLLIIITLAVPLSNILVPFSFWAIFSKHQLPSLPVKQMISFQVLWSVAVVLLFFLGVFLSNLLTKNAGNGQYIGLIIYVCLIIYNIFILLKNTSDLNRGILKLKGLVPNFF